MRSDPLVLPFQLTSFSAAAKVSCSHAGIAPVGHDQ